MMFRHLNSILLHFAFVSKLGLLIMTAASVMGELPGKNEHMIHDWWSSFTENDYVFPGNLQGAYQ